MPFMSRIQNYIFKECLLGLLLVLGVLTLAIVLIDVVEQLRTVGGDVELSLVSALHLTLLKLPMILEQTLPFGVLISAMIAYTRLNRRSELSIIRASGMSAWRFLTPIILLALLSGLFSTTLLNPLGARLNSDYIAERNKLLNEGGETIAVSASGLWLRQGDDTNQIVIHARQVEDGGLILSDVKMIEEERLYQNGNPTRDFAFVRRIDAKRATLRNGFWQLEDVVENAPDQTPKIQAQLAIPTNLDAVKLLDEFATPNTVGFWGLSSFINQTQAAGLDATRYAMRYHSLMAAPALFVAMGLIGAVVCLRLQRLGGTPRLLALGTLSAVGLYFFTQFFSSLGATGATPPAVAAWCPPLFVLFCTLTFLAYREDG